MSNVDFGSSLIRALSGAALRDREETSKRKREEAHQNEERNLRSLGMLQKLVDTEDLLPDESRNIAAQHLLRLSMNPKAAKDKDFASAITEVLTSANRPRPTLATQASNAARTFGDVDYSFLDRLAPGVGTAANTALSQTVSRLPEPQYVSGILRPEEKEARQDALLRHRAEIQRELEGPKIVPFSGTQGLYDVTAGRTLREPPAPAPKLPPAPHTAMAALLDPNATPEQKAVAQREIDFDHANKREQLAISRSAHNQSATATAAGAANAPSLDTDLLDGDVEDVLTGRNTLYNIRQTLGRSKGAQAYMEQMRRKIRAQDRTFDFVASDAGSRFVSSTFYQRAITAITSVEPNIDKAIQLSNEVSRVGWRGLDNLLQKGAIQFGNKKVANFHEAQKLIADEIGLALGQGSVTDMKLQLGFDITDPALPAEVFASNLGLVKEFITKRKEALMAQRYHSPTRSAPNDPAAAHLPPMSPTLGVASAAAPASSAPTVGSRMRTRDGRTILIKALSPDGKHVTDYEEVH